MSASTARRSGSRVGSWTLFDAVTSSTSIIPPAASAVSDEDSVTVEFNAGVDFFANSRPAVVSLATAPRVRASSRRRSR